MLDSLNISNLCNPTSNLSNRPSPPTLENSKPKGNYFSAMPTPPLLTESFSPDPMITESSQTSEVQWFHSKVTISVPLGALCWKQTESQKWKGDLCSWSMRSMASSEEEFNTAQKIMKEEQGPLIIQAC